MISPTYSVTEADLRSGMLYNRMVRSFAIALRNYDQERAEQSGCDTMLAVDGYEPQAAALARLALDVINTEPHPANRGLRV